MAQRKGKKKRVLKRERVVTDLVVQKLILQNLDKMDNRTDMAGDHSVLRVLVCWPSEPRIRAAAVADNGNHPVATVNFDKLVTSDGMKRILDSLSRNALSDHFFDAIQSEDDSTDIDNNAHKRARIS